MLLHAPMIWIWLGSIGDVRTRAATARRRTCESSSRARHKCKRACMSTPAPSKHAIHGLTPPCLDFLQHAHRQSAPDGLQSRPADEPRRPLHTQSSLVAATVLRRAAGVSSAAATTSNPLSSTMPRYYTPIFGIVQLLTVTAAFQTVPPVRLPLGCVRREIG